MCARKSQALNAPLVAQENLRLLYFYNDSLVNNLVPGRIDTERVRTLDRISAEKKGIDVNEERQAQFAEIPLGRYGSIEDMGSAGAFLLSEAARYITGVTLLVDGGKTRAVF